MQSFFEAGRRAAVILSPLQFVSNRKALTEGASDTKRLLQPRALLSIHQGRGHFITGQTVIILLVDDLRQCRPLSRRAFDDVGFFMYGIVEQAVTITCVKEGYKDTEADLAELSRLVGILSRELYSFIMRIVN